MDDNLLILKGHVSNDPRLANGCVRFTVACNRRSSEPEKNAGVDFIPCICFGKIAQYIELKIKEGTFGKGSHVYIRGSFTTGSYEKEKDGVKQTVYTYDCLVNRIDILNGSSKSQTENSNVPQQQANKETNASVDANSFSNEMSQQDDEAAAFIEMASGLPWG